MSSVVPLRFLSVWHLTCFSASPALTTLTFDQRRRRWFVSCPRYSGFTPRSSVRLLRSDPSHRRAEFSETPRRNGPPAADTASRDLLRSERKELFRLRAEPRCADNQKFIALSVDLEFHFVFIDNELDCRVGWDDRLVLRLWLANLILGRRGVDDILLANHISRGFLAFVFCSTVD